VGAAEPYTGEERPLLQKALLAVQQELTERRELDNEAIVAKREDPPEPHVVSPVKELETPEVNWAGVAKDFLRKVQCILDKFKSMLSRRTSELKSTKDHIQRNPVPKPVYSAPERAGQRRRQDME